MQLRATIFNKFENQLIASIEVESDSVAHKGDYIERKLCGRILRRELPIWDEFVKHWFSCSIRTVENEGNTYFAVTNLAVDERNYIFPAPLVSLADPDIIRIILRDKRPR
jgi:hypothetical protein